MATMSTTDLLDVFKNMTVLEYEDRLDQMQLEIDHEAIRLLQMLPARVR